MRIPTVFRRVHALLVAHQAPACHARALESRKPPGAHEERASDHCSVQSVVSPEERDQPVGRCCHAKQTRTPSDAITEGEYCFAGYRSVGPCRRPNGTLVWNMFSTFYAGYPPQAVDNRDCLRREARLQPARCQRTRRRCAPSRFSAMFPRYRPLQPLIWRLHHRARPHPSLASHPPPHAAGRSLGTAATGALGRDGAA